MKVAAIVVTYNGEDYLRECLHSLENDPAIHFIVVVDNRSTDNSVTLVETHFKQVKLIALEKNLGFGQANNVGIEVALGLGAEYFFLLNQDAYVQQTGISELVRTHEKNREFGILAPVQLNGNGSDIDAKFYDYMFNKNKQFGYDAYINKLKDIYQVEFVNAAAWLISKECLIKVGGFDPIFFHTGEDDDYAHRVRMRGYKVGIVPKVHVRHDRPQVSWAAHKPSLSRQLTVNIMKLKNIRNSYYNNLLQVVAKQVSYITLDIVKMNFTSAKIKVSAFLKALKMASAIKTSRKVSLQDFAFLNHKL